MVKINLEDGLVYTSLAYVLDRKGVYESVLDIRVHWGLGEVFVPPDKFNEWLTGYHPEMTLTKEATENYDEMVERWEIEKSRGNTLSPEDQINERKLAELSKTDLEAELLMKKFGINPKYKKVILKAIVCNRVDEEDLEFKPDNFDYDFLLDSQKLRFVIERNYRGKEKIEIRKDRDSYYRNKYDHISQYVLAKEHHESRDTLAHALRRYRRFIAS